MHNQKMADRNTSQHNNTTRPPRPTPTATTTTNSLCASHANASAFLRRLHENSPNSTQLMSVLTLVVSGGILLILTGLTLTAIISGFIFLAPLVLLSVPLWFPITAVFFVSVTGFLSFCGLGVTAVAALSWLYRYFRGLHPPGSDRFDYARSRLATTAREVKDYAREYGGYLHSKVKDAAPGA